MHFYKHNIGDFDKATRHLTRIERSIYRDLIEMYYDTEKSLPLDVSIICRKILARSNEEATLVEQTLNEFFIKTPTGWYHDRCEEEIEEYRTSKTQKSAAGIASAAKKAAKRQQAINGNSTSVQQTFNECSTDVEFPCNEQATGLQLNKKQETRNIKQETVKTKEVSPDGDLLAGIDPQVVSDFKAMRAKQKAPITQTAIHGIQREAAKAGLSLDGALRICCERSWRGFKAEWVENGGQQARASPAGYESAKDKSRREALEKLTGRQRHESSRVIDLN